MDKKTIQKWMPMVFFPALLGIIFFAAYGYNINSDEGHILNGAYNIYHGRIPYTDFFIFPGPFSFYFIYFSFALLGPLYQSALIFSILFLFLSCIAIYMSTSLLWKKNNLSYFAALLWALVAIASYPLINHNTFSSFFVIFALLFFLKFFSTHNNSFLFLSGVFTAGTLYVLQTKGIAVAFVLTAFLTMRWFQNSFLLKFRKRKSFEAISFSFVKKSIGWKNIFVFLSGCLVITIPGLALWGLEPIRVLFLIGSHYIQVSYLIFSLTSFFIFIALFIICIFFLWQMQVIDSSVKLLICVQIALLFSILNIPDRGHILINSFPLLILVLKIADRVTKKIPPLAKILSSAAMILLIAALILSLEYRLKIQSFQNNAGIKILREKIGNEEIFSYPFIPNFYFELQKKDIYFNDMLVQGGVPPYFFDINLKILEKHRPKFILTNYALVEKFQITKDTVIDQYIQKKYTQKEKIGEVQIWEQNE